MNDDIPVAGISLAILLLCALVATGMWGCPRYNVWQQTLAETGRDN